MSPEVSPERQLYLTGARAAARELAKPHTKGPDSSLVLWEYSEDYQEFPWRHPMVSHVEGHPLDPPDINNIGEMVNPRFPEMKERVNADPRTEPIIARTHQLLTEKDNVWAVTIHGDITDIAFAQQEGADQMYTRYDEFLPSSRLMLVSKMLAEVGYILPVPGAEPIDAIPTIQNLVDDVLVGWPTTEAAKAAVAKLPKSEVTQRKVEMMMKLLSILGRGGMFGALGPTGTTRVEPDEHGVHRIPPVSDGTIGLMMLGNTPTTDHPDLKGTKTYILPVATWFGGRMPLLRFTREPVMITSPEQADGVMSDIAGALTEGVEGMAFAYDVPAERDLGRIALNL